METDQLSHKSQFYQDIMENSPEISLNSGSDILNSNDFMHSELPKNEEQNFELNNQSLAIKKDTKHNNNMTKNIIKLYFKFLTHKNNSDLVQDFITNKPIKYSIKLIKKYFENMNYNNHTLIKIIKHTNYGKGFEYFLTFDVLDGLAQSKVQNLKEYFELINYLKDCCSNHEKINKIHYYKK